MGPLKRVERDGVVQYRGVRFASLEHKFADAQMYEYSDLDALDASCHGPSAIMPPNCCTHEFGLIQQSLPLPSTDFAQSDVDCLNLNITVPGGQLDEASRLPVFVFIHGGGFYNGSNAWPQYDQARIVKLSSDLSIPVIGVGINYRLGPFGFMTSAEMRSHGYSPNNGLKDQQVALQWIYKHINMFGGDSGRVTCIGESAGAVSTMLHQAAATPFCQQFVSLSGTPLMMRPLPDHVAETIYQTVISVLGLQDCSATDRMAALSSAPASEMLAKLPRGLPFLPVRDGGIVKGEVTFQELESQARAGQSQQTNLLIGSCDMDSSIFGYILAAKQSGCVQRFLTIVDEVIPQHASEILESYHIARDMTDADAWPLILDFANDINFHTPARAYASVWPSAAYQYRFREPNPWDGPWKGHSSHVLDVAYLFMNYMEHMTPSQATLAEEFASDIIKFVNGSAPFQQFEQGSTFVKEYMSENGEASSKDRGKYYDAMLPMLFSRVGYDTLHTVWAKFMSS